MEIAIVLFVAIVGIAILIYGRRMYEQMMERASEFSEVESEPELANIEPTSEVHSDGLVYLFGHKFAEQTSATGFGLGQEPSMDPVTEVELDPADWARKIVYATLWELYDRELVEWRIEPRDASFLPPCPHKAWELQLRQDAPFPNSPIMGAFEVAFEMMRQRKQKRVAQGKEEPGDVWCPLDELIERALKAMRQEIGFWERSGLYDDIRNYVASALVVQGYLLKPEPKTWLDRARSQEPQPNTEEIEGLEEPAEELQSNLYEFRANHGSPYAIGQVEVEEERQQVVEEVDPELLKADEGFDEMPLDDCLRISIYEALINLKQLEPRKGSGI